MSTPGVFLGGLAITSAEWCDAHAIIVRFSSGYTDKLYQLYAGRTLIGTTSHRDSRAVIGQLLHTRYPQVLQLVAVPPGLVTSDFGGSLPPRPYNRARVALNASSLEADAQWIDITAGTAPGGAVDSNNRLARINHAGQLAHTRTLDPLGPSGTWNFEATSRNDKPGGGNAGSPQAFSVTILTHPPDVPRQASGARFDIALSGGALTVGVTVPED